MTKDTIRSASAASTPNGDKERQQVFPLKLKQRLPVVLERFSKKDFHQVTLHEICRLSGISPGTIYQYYSSKENLTFSISKHRARRET
jgi:AcrR family transcriptional regulator